MKFFDRLRAMQCLQEFCQDHAQGSESFTVPCSRPPAGWRKMRREVPHVFPKTKAGALLVV